MSSERVLYLNSYQKNRKVYSGNFPVIVEGFLSCGKTEGITFEQKVHILSEEPDADFLVQNQYITTISGEIILSQSGHSIIYI